MISPRASWPLLSLSLVLTACPASSGRTPTPTALCPQPVSTSVPLASAAQALPAPSAPVGGSINWSAERVPGQVLVTSAGDRLGAQGLKALSGLTAQTVAPGLLRVSTPAGLDDRAFAARLAAAGLNAQPDFVYRALAVPNDPGHPANTGVLVAGVRAKQTYLNRIRAQGAWDFLTACGKTLAGAKTAVLDSGTDPLHQDLRGRLAGAITVTSDGKTSDDSGHGTAVEGLIGASTNNALGLAGMTWQDPTLLSVRVTTAGDTSTSLLAQGLERAVQAGVKVVNISLGGQGITSDPALDAQLKIAADRDVLVVAAAGNADTCGKPVDIFYPARAPSVIAVGAVGALNSELAWYSARPLKSGDRALDIVAPGGAAGVCNGSPAGDEMVVLTVSNTYALEAGTSFAAPLVSGVAALMRAANPALSATQTRALLLASVDSSGGLPLLNAEAAVQAATR